MKVNSISWFNELPELLLEYNSSIHSSHKLSPIDAHKKENESKVQEEYNKRFIPQGEAKFKEGDHVRIYKYKDVFTKKSGQRFTDEVFKVIEVNRNSYPITYNLSDLNDEKIEGLFYDFELTLSKNLNS